MAKTGRKPKGASAPPLYSSKIIKAGALLGDTKTLLAHWDVAASVQENIDRLRRGTERKLGEAVQREPPTATSPAA